MKTVQEMQDIKDYPRMKNSVKLRGMAKYRSLIRYIADDAPEAEDVCRMCVYSPISCMKKLDQDMSPEYICSTYDLDYHSAVFVGKIEISDQEKEFSCNLGED